MAVMSSTVAAEGIDSAANYFRLAIFGEAAIAANAYLASKDPHLYGAAGALLFPVAMSIGEGPRSGASSWISLGSLEVLALYNLSIDKSEKSEREIFRANVIGWHAVAAVALLTGFFSRDEGKRWSYLYVPDPRGRSVVFLAHRF